LKNLEAPTIVKSLGYRDPFDVKDRVAQSRDQVLTNRETYDIVYPDHRSYYNDKRFIVLDKAFNDTEEYLLKELKQTLDMKLDYNANAKLVHVDDLDRSKIDLNGLNLQPRAPFVHPEAVATSIRYDSKTDPAPKITSSDPYVTVMSGAH
jgi:hypothetical protein